MHPQIFTQCRFVSFFGPLIPYWEHFSVLLKMGTRSFWGPAHTPGMKIQGASLWPLFWKAATRRKNQCSHALLWKFKLLQPLWKWGRFVIIYQNSVSKFDTEIPLYELSVRYTCPCAKHVCIKLFFATLLMKSWKQSKCPPVGDWLKKSGTSVPRNIMQP